MDSELPPALGLRHVTLFGGKGGVGKTTCSAAAALHFACQGKKTLIISSDPSPSLSDIFEVELGDDVRRVPGVENLHALEISSAEVLRRWKEKFGSQFYEVFSSLTRTERVKEEVVDYIGRAPGIDELFMLDYIMERAESGRYEKLVWDTAPAGHTLHHLKTPYEFVEHLGAAVKIYLSAPSLWERFKRLLGMEAKRTPLEIFGEWRALAEKTKQFITSRESTEFVVVTIPERLGVNQTERFIAELEDYSVTVKWMIINNVITEADCDFHRKRMRMQGEYIRFLRDRYGGMTVMELPLFPYEIKGIERLREVEKVLFDSPS